METNIDAAFGVAITDRAKLHVECAIVPDARMQPFEWILGPDSKLTKTDGHGHGDCALLPGPTDVCWDLAGAIVEWNMSGAQREQFLHDYSMLSGDTPRARLPAFVIAYCAQRLGETFVAACSAELQERERIWISHERYRDELERMLGTPPVVKPRPKLRRERRLTREYSTTGTAA
jgi:hypothetical protein